MVSVALSFWHARSEWLVTLDPSFSMASYVAVWGCRLTLPNHMGNSIIWDVCFRSGSCPWSCRLPCQVESEYFLEAFVCWVVEPGRVPLQDHWTGRKEETFWGTRLAWLDLTSDPRFVLDSKVHDLIAVLHSALQHVVCKQKMHGVTV